MSFRKIICPSRVPQSCCAIGYQPFPHTLLSPLYHTDDLGMCKGENQEITFQFTDINSVELSFSLFLRFRSSFLQTLSRPKQI